MLLPSSSFKIVLSRQEQWLGFFLRFHRFPQWRILSRSSIGIIQRIYNQKNRVKPTEGKKTLNTYYLFLQSTLLVKVNIFHQILFYDKIYAKTRVCAFKGEFDAFSVNFRW